MPDDDLLALLLGCGCRKRCCCGAPDPAPTQPATPLFGQAPRTVLPPRLPDESPFIPPPPWYATGQRPRDYGFPHVPRNDAQGQPARETASPGPPGAVAIMDDGHQLPLLEPFSVDHQTRVLRPAPTLELRGIGPNRAAGEFAVFNDRFWEYALAGNGFTFALTTEAASSTHERTYTIRRDRVIPYATGQESHTDTTTTLREPTYRLQIEYTANSNGLPETVRYLRLRARRVTYEDSLPGESRILYALLALVNLQYEPRWEVININNNVWAVPVNAIRNAPAEQTWPFAFNQLANLPAQPADQTEDVVFAESATFDLFAFGVIATTPPALTHTPLAWISPDGTVRVRGPATLDHATLGPNATLETPAGNYPGPGTWAAFATLTPDPQGDPEAAQEGVALLIQQGGTMTRVDLPAGTTSTVSMAEFTQGVLRGDAWYGWSQVGLLGPTWPPHEALTRDPGSVDA